MSQNTRLQEMRSDKRRNGHKRSCGEEHRVGTEHGPRRPAKTAAAKCDGQWTLKRLEDGATRAHRCPLDGPGQYGVTRRRAREISRSSARPVAPASGQSWSTNEPYGRMHSTDEQLGMQQRNVLRPRPAPSAAGQRRGCAADRRRAFGHPYRPAAGRPRAYRSTTSRRRIQESWPCPTIATAIDQCNSPGYPLNACSFRWRRN